MNIKELREQANLTQEQLCEKVGVTQAAVSSWESGDSFPRADKLPELAKALGCSINQLFGTK